MAAPVSAQVPAPVTAQSPTQAPAPAQSTGPSEAPGDLPTVTVQGQAALGTPVTVLDAADLALRDTSTLGAALEDEPGVQATHFGAGASRPIVRGMDGPRVQVLSNGAAIADAASVSPDHAVVTEPMLAERIELLRGPSALLHGAGAIGGVVNVVDEHIPSAVPERLRGQVGLRASSAAREGAGAFALTGGSGPIAVHLAGASRAAGDYRVGQGWGSARVPGSSTRGNTGSLGVAWVGPQGHLGVSVARQTRSYGLPGHSHGAGCHPHGTHLHCGGHGHDHGHGGEHEHGPADHDGDEHAQADVPRVRMRSHRYELRGEWRQPLAGIEAVRIRGGLTRYRHDEIEDGAIATTFVNRANDWRIEAQHAPVAGWRGTFGAEGSQRRFSALGDDAYVPPSTTTRHSLFWMVQRQLLSTLDLSATLRQDWQGVQSQAQAQRLRHAGHSLALGGDWRLAPGWRASVSATTASRLPSAEELFARGLHLATRSWEQGDASLRPERARNLDLGLAKTSGPSTFAVNVFHNRVAGYIHTRTLDVHSGVQLLQYVQSQARFTGLEARAQHRFDAPWLGARWRIGAWGDVVRAQLPHGERLARLAPPRVGLTLGAHWATPSAQWDTELAWRGTRRQHRVADWETPTPGHGLLSWRLRYTSTGEQPWQAQLQVHNLGKQLAYVHTSFIKDAAPLAGRSVSLSLNRAF
jgi:iron complex outermembrane receptor protein